MSYHGRRYDPKALYWVVYACAMLQYVLDICPPPVPKVLLSGEMTLGMPPRRSSGTWPMTLHRLSDARPVLMPPETVRPLAARMSTFTSTPCQFCWIVP